MSPLSSRYVAIGSAALYATVATSMNFINKACLKALPLPMTVLALQMVCTLVVLFPLQRLGYVTIGKFSRSKAASVVFITLLYTANTGFALFGLRSLNIPMYSALKRLTPVMVLISKACITKKAPSAGVSASVGLVMLGCLVASAADLSYDMHGYGCALLSCALQAAYLIGVEHTGTKRHMGTAELLWYSALISSPVLIAFALVNGDTPALLAFFRGAAVAPGGLAAVGLVLLCALCGCMLNYSLFLCTVSNSALTTTIVGVLKGVAVTVLGFFLLGGVDFRAVNVAGICLNTMGGVWYTLAHYYERAGGGAQLVAVKHPFPSSASMLEVAQYKRSFRGGPSSVLPTSTGTTCATRRSGALSD